MFTRVTAILAGCLIAASFAHAQDAPDLSPELKRAAAISAGVREAELGNAALANVRVLVLNQRGSVDLSGIERLTNLEALELRGNSLSDLDALRHLSKLRYLDISDNRVRDLGPLAKLDQLRYLDVSENLVDSLEPLRGLKNLVTLRADRNAVSNLHPLSGLKSLKDLRLAYNRIDNLNPIAPLTQIRRLDVEHNRIPSLRPLSEMKGLARLDITNNQVAYLGALDSVTKLRVLRAEDNPVVDISPVAALERLEVLRLSSAKFNGDLAPLAKLDRLRELHMPRSEIELAGPIRNLTTLRNLDLSHNQIENAGPLVRIAMDAETIDLRGNPLNADSRVGYLPRMRGKVLYDGVTVAGIKPLFQQFDKLDRDQSGGLSHIETSVVNPAVTLEQFDALDADHDLALTRAELFRHVRPGENSLDVAWLAKKYFGAFSDGSKQAPFTRATDALAALKPNGTLKVYNDVEFDATNLTKTMKVVRVEPEKKPAAAKPAKQQTADTGKAVRVVTPKIRSEYPDPPPPEPEPEPVDVGVTLDALKLNDGTSSEGTVFLQIDASKLDAIETKVNNKKKRQERKNP